MSSVERGWDPQIKQGDRKNIDIATFMSESSVLPLQCLKKPQCCERILMVKQDGLVQIVVSNEQQSCFSYLMMNNFTSSTRFLDKNVFRTGNLNQSQLRGMTKASAHSQHPHQMVQSILTLRIRGRSPMRIQGSASSGSESEPYRKNYCIPQYSNCLKTFVLRREHGSLMSFQAFLRLDPLFQVLCSTKISSQDFFMHAVRWIHGLLASFASIFQLFISFLGQAFFVQHSGCNSFWMQDIRYPMTELNQNSHYLKYL